MAQCLIDFLRTAAFDPIGHSDQTIAQGLIVGADIRGKRHKYRDQRGVQNGLGIPLLVLNRQPASPGNPQQAYLLEAQMPTQRIDVFDTQPGIVVTQFTVGMRASAAALVKEDNVVTKEVEELEVMTGTATAGPAMQEKDRFGTRSAMPFPIDQMTVAGWVVAIVQGRRHSIGTLSR